MSRIDVEDLFPLELASTEVDYRESMQLWAPASRFPYWKRSHPACATALCAASGSVTIPTSAALHLLLRPNQAHRIAPSFSEKMQGCLRHDLTLSLKLLTHGQGTTAYAT